MIVYQALKSEFLEHVLAGQIDEIIYARFQKMLQRRTSASEQQSWQSSMSYMYQVLSNPEIPDNVGVAIEYKVPQTSKRIDVILTGLDDSDHAAAVIVELKQWSRAELTQKDGVVITQFGGRQVETSHPSYQAWTYASLLKDFNEAIYTDEISLSPCAFLHNYKEDDVIRHPFYQSYLDKAPVFLKKDAVKLQEFIKKYIRKGDDGKVIYAIESGKIRPSKQLAEAVSSMLDGHQEFIMIDDQKIVFETAKELMNLASGEEQNTSYGLAAEQVEAYTVGQESEPKDQSPSKQVLIVEGGPGTGKSVVAINLLVELTNQRLLAQYVSKNAAPRAVYESKLTGTLRPTRYRNMFKGSGAYTEANENEFDALIVDEAHRLNEKSGLYGNLGDHQVKEIINASKLSVFFIDEDQRVTLKDIGQKEVIREYAQQLGAQVTETELASQFRCDGSDGYIAWLDQMLQIRETANEDIQSLEYDFQVFDSPEEMRDEIFRLNEISNKARLVAGYCWNWVSKKDPTQDDIVLDGYDFSMKWNLASDGSLWIVSPES
ncbi:MAG: DUF2075 domain-containing protein, partial [Balneolaceae bacterium]|nr:DUF2075 domain-containing protein [Balneolaceae bacterium]